jgi:hypothetical protein
VTAQVRAAVCAEAPRLEVTNALLGDPVPGVRKALTVSYRADYVMHEATAIEKSTLHLDHPDYQARLISWCLPCHKRHADLFTTLPLVIAAANASPPVEIVIVDYGDQKPLGWKVRELLGQHALRHENGCMVVVNRTYPYFHMAHARNVSIRSATGEVVVIASADIIPAVGLFAELRRRFARSGSRLLRPSNGTYEGVIACYRDELVAAGGFDERIEFYGPEDKELSDRLDRRHVTQSEYPSSMLAIIPTPEDVKVSHYRETRSKQSMHKHGMVAWRDNEARGVLVANEGQSWGQ